MTLRRNRLWLLPLILLRPLGAAEPIAMPSLPAVAKPAANVITRPLELSFFFKKLKSLEAAKTGRRVVSILQIGDSHLQADQFSHLLRASLQKRFGDAGRGLVFPYTVAHTSNAWDLSSQSNVKWLARRSAVSAPQGLEGMDTGVSGYSILTHEPGYVLHLAVSGAEARFDTVSIFSRRDARAFGLKLSTHDDPRVLEHAGLLPRDRLHVVEEGDTLSYLAKYYRVSLDDLRQWNRIKGDRIWVGDSLIVRKAEMPSVRQKAEGFKDWASLPGGASEGLSLTVTLDQERSDIFVRGAKDGESEDEALIYGLSLERSHQSGVLYHSAGVNGAQLKAFSRSPRFFAQARCLDPDLVIVSLGTNEANGDEFKESEMEENLLTLIEGFTKGNNKYVAFLITTPPDILNWHGRLNPRSNQVAEHLRGFAAKHGLAIWDWQGVMGGSGSVLPWQEARLVSEDGVHMSPSGYAIQSQLFFKALMDAYESY